MLFFFKVAFDLEQWETIFLNKKITWSDLHLVIQLVRILFLMSNLNLTILISSCCIFLWTLKKLCHENVYDHQISNQMCTSQPPLCCNYTTFPHRTHFSTPLIIFGIHLWILTHFSISLMNYGDQNLITIYIPVACGLSPFFGWGQWALYYNNNNSYILLIIEAFLLLVTSSSTKIV